MKLLPTLILLVGLFLIIFNVAWPKSESADSGEEAGLPPTSSAVPDRVQGDAASNPQIMAQNLTVPWGLVLLPDNSILITERGGAVKKIDQTTRLITTIQGVTEVGEGGLLGLTLHPQFPTNHWVYLYLTYRLNGRLFNRVERYRLEDEGFSDKTVILDGIKGSNNHDGGRLAFGPDNLLYVTTGDAQEPPIAQDTTSLNGKILRVTDDGSIPPDNPFNNAVYSYGHRNPQGIAWDDSGRFWSTEHGPSGTNSGFDELNLIIKGGNYGWPDVYGPQTQAGTIPPVLQSGADETWAPAGLAYVKGSLYFPGLRGETLYQAVLNGTQVVEFNRHFTKQYGRLRTAFAGRNQALYVTTSNTDGRGDAKVNDDLILRLTLSKN